MRCFALVIAFFGAAACGSRASSFAPPPSSTQPSQAPHASAVTTADPSAALVVVPALADAGANPDVDASPSAAASELAPEGMLLVPGGAFTMGSDEGGQEDERPAHKVTIAPFFLDRTEVTHAQYTVCVTAGKCRTPDPKTLARFASLFVQPNKPVTGISWDDAKAYCGFVSKRLPREAEFERAVRGDDGRKYPWGNEAPTLERTVFQTSKPDEVGMHPSGKGPYGHDDLAGNVWEWMEDAYDPFAYKRPRASEGIPGSCDEIIEAQNLLRREGRDGYTGSNPIPVDCERSIRGGAYNYDALGLRSTNRVHHPGRYHLLMTGVRCAK
jgi:formylglycine-generating enzyme required for sulfatase activity